MSENESTAPRPPVAGSRAWIGRAAFEAALIVLGLVGALLVDEWRDNRERNARVSAALTSIRAELEANQKAVAAAIANHQNVISKLREASETDVRYEGGIIAPVIFSSVAWDAARDGAITNEIEYSRLTSLGNAYSSLEGYIEQRDVFTNFLYTNRTVDFRDNRWG